MGAGDERGGGVRTGDGPRRPGRTLAAALVAAVLASVAPAPGAATPAGLAGDPPLRVHADPGLERLAGRLASDSSVTAPMPGIGPPLAALPRPPELWVVRDLSRVPGASEVEPDWVAGLAIPSRGVMAVKVAGEEQGRPGALRRTARHELAHLALDRATGGGAPRWFQEGYAQLAAGDWDWSRAWRLRLAFLHGGGRALADLDLALRGPEDQARTAYLLSYTAVHRLLGMGGAAGLAALFGRLRDGATFDQALRRVYGLTEAQFVDGWRKSVRDRYGWLFFLSRASLFWVAVTVLLLVVGWRRRRYDRERMARLRREEEAEGNEAGAFGEEEGWPGDGAERPPAAPGADRTESR